MLSDMLKRMKGKPPVSSRKPAPKPMAEVEEDFSDEETPADEETALMDQESDEDLSNVAESEADYEDSFDLSGASDDELLAEVEKRGLKA